MARNCLVSRRFLTPYCKINVITTAVGDWDRSALIDPTISSDALKLVVDADHLLVESDPQGLLIDRR